MTDLPDTPRRVEWRGPEGWTIWADEDGVHLKSASGDCLEQPDVLELIGLYHGVRDQVERHAIPSPTPPTREQVRAYMHADQARYLARRAGRAVADILNPAAEQPF